MPDQYHFIPSFVSDRFISIVPDYFGHDFRKESILIRIIFNRFLDLRENRRKISWIVVNTLRAYFWGDI